MKHVIGLSGGKDSTALSRYTTKFDQEANLLKTDEHEVFSVFKTAPLSELFFSIPGHYSSHLSTGIPHVFRAVGSGWLWRVRFGDVRAS
jgi:hypothetical protein